MTNKTYFFVEWIEIKPGNKPPIWLGPGKCIVFDKSIWVSRRDYSAPENEIRIIIDEIDKIPPADLFHEDKLKDLKNKAECLALIELKKQQEHRKKIWNKRNRGKK